MHSSLCSLTQKLDVDDLNRFFTHLNGHQLSVAWNAVGLPLDHIHGEETVEDAAQANNGDE
eukprot:10581316-Alexandrium_andersonii.AAC.1